MVTARPKATLLLLFLLFAPAFAMGTPKASISLTAVMGAAYDRETGESVPARGIAGLEINYGPFGLSAIVDCGLPWEPAARIDADATMFNFDIFRLSANLGFTFRSYEAFAAEYGFRMGARTEIGPRFLALTASGGVTFLSTAYAAIGGALADVNPWASIGILVRPVAPLQCELLITTDSPLALWARTSFELHGSWDFPSGSRISAAFALRYSDFFTLTSYIDGFQTTLLYSLPLIEESR
jgi:hypothetical protein